MSTYKRDPIAYLSQFRSVMHNISNWRLDLSYKLLERRIKRFDNLDAQFRSSPRAWDWLFNEYICFGVLYLLLTIAAAHIYDRNTVNLASFHRYMFSKNVARSCLVSRNNRILLPLGSS